MASQTPVSPQRPTSIAKSTSNIITDPILEEGDGSSKPKQFKFDIISVYKKQLMDEDVGVFMILTLQSINCCVVIQIPMPIAAVLALTELIASSNGWPIFITVHDPSNSSISAETMYELVEALKEGAATLKRASPNPISLTAGCDLFIRYVTTATQEFTVSISVSFSLRELSLDLSPSIEL